MAKYKVLNVGNITPTILSLKLERQDNERQLTFLPGQYATISFIKHHRPSAARCFSIASSPNDLDILEFGIRIGGKYTTALKKLLPGDTVIVGGPHGSFTFNSHTQKDVVMIAGGIGITPFISMMRYATQLRLDNKLTLVFGVRNQQDIAYFDELLTMSAGNPKLSLAFVVSEGETNLIPPEHKVFSGRITPEVIENVTNCQYGDRSFFICGPPPFMNGISNILNEKGVEKDYIVTEAFSQGHNKQTGRSRGWPFNIYTIGAVGTLASSVIVMSSDMVKSIPPTLLPTTLENEQTIGSSREQELDILVNSLEQRIASNLKSPAVIAAEKEVADAQLNSASPSGVSSTGSAAPSPAVAVPPVTKTTTKAPVCKTNASGVRKCI